MLDECSRRVAGVLHGRCMGVAWVLQNAAWMLLWMLNVHCMHAEECVRSIFRDSSEHARAGRPAPQNFTSLQQVPHVQWLTPKSTVIGQASMHLS